MKIKDVDPKICKEEILGVAYSGGGNRGAIHFGIMKALIEEEIKPTHIAGVSAGAFVGAFHAADPTSLSYLQPSPRFDKRNGTGPFWSLDPSNHRKTSDEGSAGKKPRKSR